jgi:hypothetical protein
MTAPTTLDWDAWRNAYPTLTYREQQDFHSLIYAQYPEQRHYDPTYVARAIEDTLPLTVVELGGWDGELAAEMLDRYQGIQGWVNVEICREASDISALRHPRLAAAEMDDYYWTQDWECDLFVGSHVIEHLSTTHLQQTIQATDARALFFDAPLEDHALNWRHFTGTHILGTGWAGVTSLCNQHGYSLAWAEDHETDPSSGGHARACLYVREAKGGP